MANNTWKTNLGINLGTIEEYISYSYELPLINPVYTITALVSGTLPLGLTLADNIISGIPTGVDKLRTFKFTIRAIYNGILSDLSFIIKVKEISIWKYDEKEIDLGTINGASQFIYTFPLDDRINISTNIVGYCPAGLTLVNNVMHYFPNEVTILTDIMFVVRATYIDKVSDKNIALKVKMPVLWTNDTTTIDLGIIQEATPYTFNLPLGSSTGINSTIIAGTCPPGLKLIDNVLTGMPFEVAELKSFKFVIRADIHGRISDRTFYVKVNGPNIPNWISAEGTIPIGTNDSYYILDESLVDFQLIAIDSDTIAGQVLSYWIDSNSGVLPPGLTLSPSGRIQGFIHPLLAQTAAKKNGFYDTTGFDTAGYDKGIISSYGFDSAGYDFIGYDVSETFAQPRKLNRNYEFIVSISDGNTVAKRKFKIYVIGDDSFFIDNEIILSSSLEFTSDITSLRDPIWLTDSNLGIFRANNYQTIKIDIYDTIDKHPVLYSLDTFNSDGTVSQIPLGLQFDSTTSELFGIIPYQPAVTKIYNFTITATRIGKVRKHPSAVKSDQYPIKLDNDIVYRNYAENNVVTEYVYTSVNYVAMISGVKLQRLSISQQWIFENHDLNIKYYSNIDAYYPWDILFWYTDSDRTNPVTGPILNVIPTEVGTYYNNYDTSSSSKLFTIKVIGEIDNNIEWITPASLGTMEVELPCNLFVTAKCFNNNTINYSIIGGELPPGLKMDSTGQISGKINQFNSPAITRYDFTMDDDTTTIDRMYSFDILATDIAKTSQISKTFSILISVPNTIPFSNIIVRPMLKTTQRNNFRLFITNNEIFESKYIYRPGDSNFGIQDKLNMLIFGGIETNNIKKVMSVINNNHARKHFKFGDLKIAQAKNPGTHAVVYDVIYIDMVDPLEIGKKHLPSTIHTSKDNIPITIDNNPFIVTIDRTNINSLDSYTEYKQPSSISLWRHRIAELGINDRHYLPLWMRTIQTGNMVELDFTPAVVLCYCKPGSAGYIMSNINNHIKTTNFNFNSFDYDIDRFIISAITPDYTKYDNTIAYNIGDNVLYTDPNSNIDTVYTAIKTTINNIPTNIEYFEQNLYIKPELYYEDKYILFHPDRTVIA